MTDRHPVEQSLLPFVAKCAAVLPVLWLALFLLALPFPGGHPSLPALVAIVPVNLSLTGGAAGWLTGDPGSSSVRLAVLVVATLIELGFVRQISSSGCLTMNHQKNWDQCRSIGSYETLLTRLAIVTLAVACLMFVMPPYRMPASQG